MYYNTTNSAEQELSRFRIQNKRQENIVLQYMQIAKRLTPSEVLIISEFDGYNWPITSIRRSLNTLTREGLTVKTQMKLEGPQGRDEHIWEMKEQ